MEVSKASGRHTEAIVEDLPVGTVFGVVFNYTRKQPVGFALWEREPDDPELEPPCAQMRLICGTSASDKDEETKIAHNEWVDDCAFVAIDEDDQARINALRQIDRGALRLLYEDLRRQAQALAPHYTGAFHE